MQIQKIGKISGGQDGAIYNKLLFRFDHEGNGAVFALKGVKILIYFLVHENTSFPQIDWMYYIPFRRFLQFI